MTGLVGSLSDTPLAQVIRRIVTDERSGDLQVTTPEAIKTVYFDRGFIVFASSNRKRDRLGESMVESGRISKREFDVASELMKASRVKFGKALVSSGIVSEEELGHYVAAQVNRIVLSLFSAKQGMYSFDERPSVIPMDIMVSLSAYRILLEGIRHMTSKSLVLTGLPSLDADLQVVDQPPFALDLDALRPAERGVLKALSSGPTTCRVIADRVGGNEGVVLRAVYGLLASGVVEQKARTEGPLLSIQMETGTFVLSDISQRVVEPPATVSPELQRRALEVTPTPSPPREVARSREAPTRSSAPTAEERPVDQAPAGFLDWLKSVWSAVLSWLGLSTSADAPDIGIAPAASAARPRPAQPPGRPPQTPKRASGRRAPEPVKPVPAAPPPPDRIGVPSWSVLDEEEAASSPPLTVPREPEVPEWSVTDNPAAQFQDFFEELGVPLGQTAEPEVEPEPLPEARPRAQPQPRAQPVKARPAAPARSAPPPVVVNDSDFMVSDPDFPEDDAPSMFSPIPVEEVVSEDASIDLEVEDEVDLDVEIEVEIEPPDEPELEPEPEPEPDKPPAPARMAPPAPEPALDPLRAEVSEPEETPEPDLAREQARRRIAQSGGEGRLIRDVKLHFKLRDWEGAVPLIEQLVEISPGKALYRAMLGRALSRTASRRKEAEAHFVEALRLAPRDAEIHYWLGLYYKSFGLGSRAVNEFKTTLRIDPRHEGARRQLGVAGRPDDPLGSVLKKLFG